MARVFADQLRVDNSDLADYPNGRLKDTVGPTEGTAWKEGITGDVYQFFQKLLIDASITANGLPDNVSNGYDLIDALVYKVGTKRATTRTILNASMITSEVNICSLVLDADNGYDDVKISTNFLMALSGGNDGVRTLTVRTYIDGVLKFTATPEATKEVGVISEPYFSCTISGDSYVAGDVILITGELNADSLTIQELSMVVEGINV